MVQRFHLEERFEDTQTLFYLTSFLDDTMVGQLYSKGKVEQSTGGVSVSSSALHLWSPKSAQKLGSRRIGHNWTWDRFHLCGVYGRHPSCELWKENPKYQHLASQAASSIREPYCDPISEAILLIEFSTLRGEDPMTHRRGSGILLKGLKNCMTYMGSWILNP